MVSGRKRSIRSPRVPSPKLHDTVRLSANGVAKVLGDLEARILVAIWSLGHPVTTRTVHDEINDDHPISPLTVITVLNKLVDKRILSRRKIDDLYHYEATMNEATFRAHVSRRVVEGILSFGPEAVAASFVDVLAERNPAQLEELGRLIRKRLRDQG